MKKVDGLPREKVVYPSSEFLKTHQMEKTLRVEESQIGHDAIVGSFCLMMSNKLDCVRDAMIEDFFTGEKIFRSASSFYPDALLSIKTSKRHFQLPVELERTQKSQSRILEKFYGYEENSVNSDVLFCFVDERVAKKYLSVFESFRDERGKSIESNFMFTWANGEDFSMGRIEKFNVLYPPVASNLKELFCKLS